VLRSDTDRDNVLRLEQALSGLGLKIWHQGDLVIATGAEPPRINTCSQLVDLVVTAPRHRQTKAIKKNFRMRGDAVDGRRDKDAVVLKCGAPPL
jgi:hypothetical protein